METLMKPNCKADPATQEMISKMKKYLCLDESKIEAAWERLERKLDAELKVIHEQGENLIPEVQFEEIIQNNGKIPDDIEAEVAKRGVLIVRSVLSQSEATNCLNELTDYMKLNGEDPEVIGRTFYECYWSKAQVKARQHENIVLTQKALLRMWKKDSKSDQEKDDKMDVSANNQDKFVDTSVNLDKLVMYIDRHRYRKPGTGSKLTPHMDSGSITRWSDPIYRNTYKKIYSGNWEDYEPFVVGGRGICTMDEHCSFFRAFQGWTSLTEGEPDGGTLRVFPLLKEATAYALMRPLLSDILEDELPGYRKGKLFFLDQSIHSRIYDSVISIPKVFPGDTVWWHPDLIHSVEAMHNGRTTNTVLYIPVGPDCPINRLYVERMKFHFLSGLSPPDFNLKPENERYFKNRATILDLSPEGKRMMGFEEENNLNVDED